MPRVQWPLHRRRTMVQVVLTVATGGHPLVRDPVADTGAGTSRSGFELLLEEKDCLVCGGIPSHPVVLGGAYTGTFSVYVVRVQLPAPGFDHHLRVVAVPACPVEFDGIACFRFLNRFTYGNFSDPGRFGLEA
jgi:hypothetical protein